MKNNVTISVNSSDELLKLGESLGEFNTYYKKLHEQKSFLKRSSLPNGHKAKRIVKLNKQLAIVKSKIVQIEHLINGNEAQYQFAFDEAKCKRKIQFMFNYVSPHNFVALSDKEKEKLFLSLNGNHGIGANFLYLLGSKQHFNFYRSQLQKQIHKQIKQHKIKAKQDKFYALINYVEFIELKEKLALLVDEQKTLKSGLKN